MRTMRSRITVCTALLLAIFLSFPLLQELVYLPSGIENPMPVRFLQLLTAPAPSWLNEGVRATYSALVGSSETEYLEHKDLEAGQAGNGINQLDIVAIDDGQAAIMNEAYALVLAFKVMFLRQVFRERCVLWWRPALWQQLAAEISGAVLAC
jgi:hypothetical protein